MKKFIRLSDNAVVTEFDLDPLCKTPSPYFNPGEGYAEIRTWAQPAFDQYTQKVVEIAPALVDDIWTEQWQIVELTGEELAEAQAKKVADDAAAEQIRVSSLWQAATNYEQSFIANMAIGLLTMGVMQGKPKATEIAAWSNALWNGPNGYYARKANGSTNYDYSDIGPMPYSVPELSKEVYGG